MTLENNSPVECEEPGTIITTVTSTLATGADGKPQLIQRIMKALGMGNLILYSSCVGERLKMRISQLG